MTLDVTVRIQKFKDLIDKYYQTKLLEHARKGIKRLTIDFQTISLFEPELALILLDEPEETIRTAEIAIEQFQLPGGSTNFKVRIKNANANTLQNIRHLRSINVGTFVTVRGVIRSRTSVTPRITTMRFECPNCAAIISVLQLEDKIKEPNTCSCGRKGKFRILSKTLVDGLSVRLEESPEEVDSNRLESINALVQCDLTEEKIESKIVIGRIVEFTGIFKTIMVSAKDGGKLTQLSTYLEVNYINFLETEDQNLKLSREDIEQIKQLSKDDDFLKKASQGIFHKIQGHDDIKEVLTLQAFGGIPIYDEKGKLERRGTIDILFCGEPGCAKSFFLNQAKKLHPKHYSVLGGRSTSVAGLLYAVTKDPLLGQWSLDAGAFPLAHGGIVMIDEMDKFDQKELDQIHGPMEDQIIYVNKANIRTTLKCECAILAASNPKFGRFSKESSDFVREMELSTTLINRFDLIYLIKDEVDFEKDKAIALKMLRIAKDTEGSYIENTLFKKYVLYARKLNPTISDEIEDAIATEMAKIKGLGKGKTYPITQRQYVTIIRLAEAKARSRLSNRVSMTDVNYAITTLIKNLMQFIEHESNNDMSNIDIDIIETGTRATERNKIDIVLKIIYEYMKENGNNSCPIEHIETISLEKGIDPLKMEKVLEMLLRYGEIFETKRGFYKKVM